jgi:hypothetical protein
MSNEINPWKHLKGAAGNNVLSLSFRERRRNLGVDGPLFLRYGYFMPRPSMIRGDDIQGKIPRFLS